MIYIIIIYFVLAPFVFAAIDNKEQWLYKESKKITGLTKILFWVLWPVIVYKWITRKRKS